MKFFTDYKNLKCNSNQFEIIKPYLYADGWMWYGDDKSTPEDLALIQPHHSYEKDNKNKFFIAYYEDELEYLSYDKDVIEIIREIKINKLLE